MQVQSSSIKFLNFTSLHFTFFSLVLIIALVSVWYSAIFIHGNALIPISFSIYIITIILSIITIGKSKSFIHPVIFFILWFELFKGFIPRFDIYLTGILDHRAVYGISDSTVIVKHLLLSSLFTVSLTLGYFLSTRLKAIKFEFPKERHSTFKLLLFFLISFASFIFIIKGAGGIGAMLLQRGLANDERFLSQFDSGPLIVSVRILRYLCIAWLAVNIKTWRSPIFIFIFLCSLFMTFVVTGSRGGILLPIIIAAIITFSSLKLKKIPYTKVLLVSFFLLVILGITSQFREVSRGKSDVSEVELDSTTIEKVEKAIESITSYAVDGDGSFAVLAQVPSSENYLLGKSYLSIPFAVIPSNMLPFDKPQAGGKLTADILYNADNNTIPPKYIGESFWNFSYFGVFFIALFYGTSIGYLYKTLALNNYNPILFALYLLTIFSLQPTSDGFYAWLHTVIPVFIFIIFITGIPKRISP